MQVPRIHTTPAITVAQSEATATTQGDTKCLVHSSAIGFLSIFTWLFPHVT